MTSVRRLKSAKIQTRRALSSVRQGARQLRKTRELAAASSDTILHRTELLKKAIRSGEGLSNPEFVRMGSEKLKALSDSMSAAAPKAAALNPLLARYWRDLTQRSITSAFAFSRCRSPGEAAAVSFGATTAMMADGAAFGFGLIRWNQQLLQAAIAPIHRVATGNARRLGS
jgi:hypothetical protein